jgi:RNA polymerase-binding protein DksA
MAELTKKQIQTLRQRMVDRQRALVAEVNEQRSRTAEDGNEDVLGGVGDAGDESVQRMVIDLHLQEAGRDLEELRDIDGALRRIDDGEYGDCEQCGNEIGYPRLEVQPTASRCIQCQSQYEKTYAVKGKPTL